MHTTPQILAGILLLCVSSIGLAEIGPSADLIITNCRIWTVDVEHPNAEAVAVLGDRIVAVGKQEQIAAWRGAETKLVDGRQRLLLPGFNDSHIHFFSGGRQLENVDLRDAKAPEEFVMRIEQHSRKLANKEWIVGGNWDDQSMSPGELPTKQLIDPVTPETPVFVIRYDGHMGLANSLALRLAGVTAETKDPAGGLIVRNAGGEPTGILKDAAMELVERVIPPLSPLQLDRFARQSLAHAARHGVTSVQTMNCSHAEFRTLGQLAESSELTTRVYAAPIETTWEDQAKLGIRHAFGSPYLRLGALKGYADGSLGSSTAYFFDPYTDDSNNRGLLSGEMQPRSGILKRMIGADKAGLQLCIHGIGDRAISEVLDLFQQVRNANGEHDRRFRIEHSQHVAPKDFERYHRLGVIASVQPYHAIDDGRWAEGRIGPLRAQSTYAFRTFIDSDVRLALGTDWPVAPLNPLFTIYAAVTRATLDGQRNEGWVPEQRISVAEAVHAYTLGSAYAEFQETMKGSIQVGKLADMVILDGDIFSIPAHEIRNVKVDLTIVGGRIVWDRSTAH
jgi:predicted amidohydrolase YtcJ